MTKFALQARWVLSVDAPPIAGGVVTIEDGTIVAIGTRVDSGAAHEDLGDVVLMPGLVNAHTHLEFSYLAAPLGRPGMPLPEWVRLVISQRKQQAESKAAVIAGLRESLQSGVTTIGEIATSRVSEDELTQLPHFLAFHEVIGFSAARVDSVFAELEQRLQTSAKSVSQHPKAPSSSSSPENGGGEFRNVGISPHAPYTVHPTLLEKLVALAKSRHLPVAMHLAESTEELQLLSNNRGPFRELLEERSMWDGQVFAGSRCPLDYLQILAAAPRSLVVHGNYLSSAEIEFIAQQRATMSVVYCPRTHAFFEQVKYPLVAMLDAGVRVALGTDSRASNPDLSLLNELRCVARKYPNLPPEQVLTLGTLNGAEALGLVDIVGSLAPGKLADLVAIECDPAATSPLENVLMGDRPVQRVWLRGQSQSPNDQ